MLHVLTHAALVTLAVYLSVSVAYYLGLAFCYFAIPERPARTSAQRARIAVVIPAHDESLILGTTLRQWAAVRYPADRFTLFVIADNCTDDTATIARAHGAVCLERSDPQNRGKGQALAWALTAIPIAEFDAVAIVDADCAVSPMFLEVMSARLAAGAKVIQGFDGVLNPDESMLTRLIQITNVMKNRLFMAAKAKVGLSAQLMGTGMCFDRTVLQRLSWTSFSIGEDLEQSTRLTEAGIHVDFAQDAVIYAHEATGFRQAYSQRVRWASSRMQLFTAGAKLLGRGLLRRNAQMLDAGMSLVVPNYALLANATIVGLGAAWVLGMPTGLRIWFGVLLAAEALYFGLGLLLSGLSPRSAASLALAPVFLGWKAVVDVIALFGLGRRPWVRTSRGAAPPQEAEGPGAAKG